MFRRTKIKLETGENERENDKNKRETAKSSERKAAIRQFLLMHAETTTAELVAEFKLSHSRIRSIVAGMDEIEAIGADKVRKYRLKKRM